MGSGARFKIIRIPEVWGFGLFIGRFPFDWTINLHFAVWSIEVGIGKAYDK